MWHGDIFTCKPFGIFGGGVTARGVKLLLEKYDYQYIVYDKNSEKHDNFTDIDAQQHSFIIVSPSFLPHHPWIKIAARNSCCCITEIELAQYFTNANIIAITGTNGKTTITKFLSEFFNYNHLTAYAAGNIGLPLCELLSKTEIKDSDIIFYEMSSFQAASVKKCNLAGLIWSNYYPSHLNIHTSETEYLLSKYKLLRFLTSKIFICGESVIHVCKEKHLSLPQFTHVCTRNELNKFYDNTDSFCQLLPTNVDITPENNHLIENQTTCPVPFNSFPQMENFHIIKTFCQCFFKNYERKLSLNTKAKLDESEINLTNFKLQNLSKSLINFASHFQLPRYRLEFLGNINGNLFWNDSKCTNFHALNAALQNFSEPIIWIGGGRSKGENLNDIIPIVKDKVEMALLIGEVADELKKLLKNYNICAINIKRIENLKKFIKKACILRKNIVLSPSFASFDQFQSFEKRGECFEKIVLELKNDE